MHAQLPEPPKHSLTIGELLANQTALGRTVGCIVDLSNHGGWCGHIVARVF